MEDPVVYPATFITNYLDSVEWAILQCSFYKFLRRASHYVKEGANKQVISSQADSLIKISRIWADFFPANTSNQPI